MILMKNQTPQNIEEKSTIWGDIKFSFHLYKQNFKPIFWVSLIRFLAIYSASHALRFVFHQQIYNSMPNMPVMWIEWLLRVPSDLISFGFWGAIVGMAYDIMSSGDGFADLKNSFYYIKKYWFPFVILSLLVNLFIYVIRLVIPWYVSMGEAIILRTFSFFWSLLFMETSAGLVSRHNIRDALKDNFKLLFTCFKRIFKTFGVFYLLFMVGRILLGYYLWYYGNPSSIVHLIVIIVLYTWNVIHGFLGSPMYAFLTIGIYNEELRYKNQEIKNV
ncbi:hypothetical protein WKT22_03737 [Candidatus Lokiarchaeum ossiferum]